VREREREAYLCPGSSVVRCQYLKYFTIVKKQRKLAQVVMSVTFSRSAQIESWPGH